MQNTFQNQFPSSHQMHRLFKNPGCKDTRWFKYDRDDLCVNKSQFVPIIFEPPWKTGGTKREILW
jgi:hypothetical protein